MEQTKAPKLTPSPRKVKNSNTVAKDSNPTAVFISMALDMSWRLAIAVLVPVIGGGLIDKHHKSGHTYLIIGFVVALIAGVLVVYQSYRAANSLTESQGDLNK
jgi:F0F1-type ATP synthase assembly protein I